MAIERGKYAIQEFWFCERRIESVMECYGIGEGHPLHDKVAKLLNKTKRDFRNGWSFFTREDIDAKIRSWLAERV